jgi:hypothetical protein
MRVNTQDAGSTTPVDLPDTTLLGPFALGKAARDSPAGFENVVDLELYPLDL